MAEQEGEDIELAAPEDDSEGEEVEIPDGTCGACNQEIGAVDEDRRMIM